MLTWKIPSQYGVLAGPEIVPVQWNMSSSLTGAAEQVGRGSFWRFSHSFLIRRKVILTFVTIMQAERIAVVMEFDVFDDLGCLLSFVSFRVLSLTSSDSCVTPSSRPPRDAYSVVTLL